MLRTNQSQPIQRVKQARKCLVTNLIQNIPFKTPVDATMVRASIILVRSTLDSAKIKSDKTITESKGKYLNKLRVKQDPLMLNSRPSSRTSQLKKGLTQRDPPKIYTEQYKGKCFINKKQCQKCKLQS